VDLILAEVGDERSFAICSNEFHIQKIRTGLLDIDEDEVIVDVSPR